MRKRKKRYYPRTIGIKMKNHRKEERKHEKKKKKKLPKNLQNKDEETQKR